MTLDGYNATFGTDEVAQPWTDAITGTGKAIVDFAPLIGLVLVYKFFKRKGMKA